MAENDSNTVSLKADRKLMGNQSVNVTEAKHFVHPAFGSNLFHSHQIEKKTNGLNVDVRIK